MATINTDIHLDSGHLLKDEYFECHGVHNVQLYVKGKMVGRALVIVPSDRNEFVLLDINIHDECNRRKGWGSEIMKYLTDYFSPILTSYRTSAGRDICLKHGFRLRKAFHKKEIDILTYIRGMK
jgi:hypothetical protein